MEVLANITTVESSLNSSDYSFFLLKGFLQKAFPTSLNWNESPPHPTSPLAPWTPGSAQNSLCARMALNSPTHTTLLLNPAIQICVLTLVPVSSSEVKLLMGRYHLPLAHPSIHTAPDSGLCMAIPQSTRAKQKL